MYTNNILKQNVHVCVCVYVYVRVLLYIAFK